MHVAADAGDVQRLAAVIALDQADHFRRGLAFVHQPAHAQRGLQAQGDFGLHIGQLQLHQLGGGQRAVELLAVQRVLAGGVPAEFRRAHGAPGDAVAGLVQAAKRAFQAFDIRQQVVVRHKHIVHDDFAGDRRAQRELAVNLRHAQARHAAIQNKATDFALVVLGPHHAHIGNRAVGDPHLAAVQRPAAVHLAGASFHAGRVGAGIRLGQAKAAHPLAGGQLGQVFVALGIGAVGVNRVHHQRALHTHCRAIARIHPLDFARHQAVGHMAQAGAAPVVQRAAQEAQLAHLAHDFAVEALFAVGGQHARQQLVLTVGAGAVAHHALFFSELRIQQQGIVPLKRRARIGHDGSPCNQSGRVRRAGCAGASGGCCSALRNNVLQCRTL